MIVAPLYYRPYIYIHGAKPPAFSSIETGLISAAGTMTVVPAGFEYNYICLHVLLLAFLLDLSVFL